MLQVVVYNSFVLSVLQSRLWRSVDVRGIQVQACTTESSTHRMGPLVGASWLRAEIPRGNSSRPDCHCSSALANSFQFLRFIARPFVTVRSRTLLFASFFEAMSLGIVTRVTRSWGNVFTIGFRSRFDESVQSSRRSPVESSRMSEFLRRCSAPATSGAISVHAQRHALA